MLRNSLWARKNAPNPESMCIHTSCEMASTSQAAYSTFLHVTRPVQDRATVGVHVLGATRHRIRRAHLSGPSTRTGPLHPLTVQLARASQACIRPWSITLGSLPGSHMRNLCSHTCIVQHARGASPHAARVPPPRPGYAYGSCTSARQPPRGADGQASTTSCWHCAR